MSRWGGFRTSRRILNDWASRVSPSSTAIQPVTIQEFSYTDAQGIWNLRSTTEFPNSGQSSYGGTSTSGQVAYAIPGTYSWTCPSNITSVCVVCVGGGDFYTNGGGGGGLGWKNNIAVSPGQSYSVVVGSSGSDSYFIDTTTVKGGGASGRIGGSYTGDGGGSGGAGPISGSRGGGGGAGGYSGSGGNGADNASGSVGAGGAGGGGGYSGGLRIGGGGVGILGQGTSGSSLGGAGSGGTDGASGRGGSFGGGAPYPSTSTPGTGAVRIIWGAGRAFPSTNTGDV